MTLPGDDVLSLIFRRRSVRRYTAEPVADDCLRDLLRAAMAAPSACNSQPWEFVAVTDPEVLAALRDALPAGRYNAPAAVVVCGSPRVAHNTAGRMYWVQDCSAATENLLVAAAGLGLGTVWIGVYPLPEPIRRVSAALGLPDDVTPLCLVWVGHPADEPAPRTQYDERRVYWQSYEPRKRRARLKNAKYRQDS